MAFDLRADDAWRPAGQRTLYRWIPPGVAYGVVAPWPGSGRFDCGAPTLYFSESGEGALAEYYRRHPELLPLQQRIKLQLYRIDFDGVGEGLDVAAVERAEAVGVPWDRLRSSDARAVKRYKETHELAEQVVAEGGCSIAYPSAAYDDETNVVTFGYHGDGWTTEMSVEVAHPFVEPDAVRVLPSGAD